MADAASLELAGLRELLDIWSRDMTALAALLLQEQGVSWAQCLARSNSMGAAECAEAVARIFRRGGRGVDSRLIRETLASCTASSRLVKPFSALLPGIEYVAFIFDRDDHRMDDLLERRFALVEKIAVLKREHHLALHHPERELEVMAYAARVAVKCGLPPQFGSAAFRGLGFPLAYALEEMVIDSADE